MRQPASSSSPSTSRHTPQSACPSGVGSADSQCSSHPMPRTSPKVRLPDRHRRSTSARKRRIGRFACASPGTRLRASSTVSGLARAKSMAQFSGVSHSAMIPSAHAMTDARVRMPKRRPRSAEFGDILVVRPHQSAILCHPSNPLWSGPPSVWKVLLLVHPVHVLASSRAALSAPTIIHPMRTKEFRASLGHVRPTRLRRPCRPSRRNGYQGGPAPRLWCHR